MGDRVSCHLTKFFPSMLFASPEAALFICPMCNKLAIITDDFFESNKETTENSPGQFSPYNSLITSKKKKSKKGVIVDIIQDTTQWQYIDELERLMEELQAYSFLHFPVCPFCSHMLVKRIMATIEMTRKDTEILSDLTKESIDYLLEEIKEKIATIHKQNHVMKLVNQSSPKELSSSQSSESLIPKQKRIPQFFEKTPPTSKHFILASTFYISYFEQIGTINNMRLGLFYQEYVPIQEVNGALFEVCHLILNLSRILKRGNIDMKLSSTVLFPKQDQTGNITYSLPLAITGYDSKKLQVFNEALFILFSYVVSLYMIKEGVFDPLATPPYLIDLKNKRIGEYSFEVSTDNLSIWNFPMKLLLLNLKCIQIQVIMRDDL